jgi:WD40 repeat protein
VLSFLPPSPKTLLQISLVNKHFQTLVSSPALWARIFHSTPGFSLITDKSRTKRIRATTTPPNGTWDGHDWRPDGQLSSPGDGGESIPIHYPTLYRSRLALSRYLKGNAHAPDLQILNAHTDTVYCVHLAYPWIITGSRDRTIRFWHISLTDGKVRLVKTVDDAHGGSVLALKVEGNMMVSGSSDMTAGVWTVKLDNDRAEVDVVRGGSLCGHTDGVLDVLLTGSRIISWYVQAHSFAALFRLDVSSSKDTTIRIWDRNTLSHLHTITEHSGSVNGLALNFIGDAERFTSVSSDTIWIIWDLETRTEIRRGTVSPRGLASVAWAVSQSLALFGPIVVLRHGRAIF